MQASALTNGKTASIRSNFSETLANFSDDILNLLEQFTLNKVPSTINGHNLIRVKVNGVFTEAFVYLKESNSIRFYSANIPDPESTIEVFYETLDETLDSDLTTLP